MPIVVGGTGFYLRWFTHGKAQGPKTTPEAIAHVQQALKQVGVHIYVVVYECTHMEKDYQLL